MYSVQMRGFLVGILSCLTWLHVCECQDLNRTQARFWLDDYAFGVGETDILKEAVLKAQNAVIAGRTANRFLALKGYQLSRKWDIYWTTNSVSFFFRSYITQIHDARNC